MLAEWVFGLGISLASCLRGFDWLVGFSLACCWLAVYGFACLVPLILLPLLALWVSFGYCGSFVVGLGLPGFGFAFRGVCSFGFGLLVYVWIDCLLLCLDLFS